MQNRMDSQKAVINEILLRIMTEDIEPLSDDFLSNSSFLDDEHIASDQLIEEIYHHIILARVMIDISHGIQSRLLTLSNGTTAYVRYVDFSTQTQVDFDQQKIAAYNYLRMFYAYLLSAIAISKIYQFDNDGFIIAV